MPTTSIPIPSSVSPITNLKDFIDKGRQDMLSFLASIGGTYIFWAVFPATDSLTSRQSEEERRVAEMVDQIDRARVDLALDSINGGSFLPSAIDRAPLQGTPARNMDGAELFAGTQSEAEDEWHEPDPGGHVEKSMTAQKSTLASSSSAAKGKWGNKDIQNALLAWILKACDDSRHYFHDIANRHGSPNVGKEALLRLCNIIAPPDGMHRQKVNHEHNVKLSNFSLDCNYAAWLKDLCQLRLMREYFKEHGSSVLDLFRQILLQIEYAGGSDNPITLLCTRWNLKLDNWTSTSRDDQETCRLSMPRPGDAMRGRAG